jgi:hypothetical protein
VLSADFEAGSPLALRVQYQFRLCLTATEKSSCATETAPHMSQISSTSTQPPVSHGPTVERRIATALWNQDERNRIIAMKAYELFCSRGCEHGFDLDDWLSAEREQSSEADDVVIMQSEVGFDISIAERARQERILLSIAPISLLILWTGAGTNSSEQDAKPSTLRLASLPEPTHPARAEVAYRDGRVWVHLPYVGNTSEPNTPAHERGPGT